MQWHRYCRSWRLSTPRLLKYWNSDKLQTVKLTVAELRGPFQLHPPPELNPSGSVRYLLKGHRSSIWRIQLLKVSCWSMSVGTGDIKCSLELHAHNLSPEQTWTLEIHHFCRTIWCRTHSFFFFFCDFLTYWILLIPKSENLDIRGYRMGNDSGNLTIQIAEITKICRT